MNQEFGKEIAAYEELSLDELTKINGGGSTLLICQDPEPQPWKTVTIYLPDPPPILP
jgi:bacteriocin-like protein